MNLLTSDSLGSESESAPTCSSSDSHSKSDSVITPLRDSGVFPEEFEASAKSEPNPDPEAEFEPLLLCNQSFPLFCSDIITSVLGIF
jgi:hypothetical protein